MSISIGRSAIPFGEIFEQSFAVVVRALLEKEQGDESLPPKYYDCGVFCGETQQAQNDFCRMCPAESSRKEFESAARRELKRYLGDDWEQVDLDNLVTTAYKVSGLKIDHKTTVQTARLIRIFKSEEARRRRTESYNAWRQRQQASQNV